MTMDKVAAMETHLPSGAPAAAQDNPARRRCPWVELAIVAVALLLRLLWLGVKPAHFDEGVNGWFVDQMTEQGYYHYDPTNFHGPLHFYILFVAQTLFGRHTWALRLPVALVSTACVALALGFGRFLGVRACRYAAAAMALSPAFVFYGRYAIHETELVFFLMLAGWGLLGMARRGGGQYHWGAALGATGAILTKETYAIHFIAFALAVPALLLLERLTRRRAEEPLLVAVRDKPDPWTLAGVCGGLILFFYSGAFLDWSALPGIITTFGTWVSTGTDQTGGHGKEWYYWLDLLTRYEWPALFGLAWSLWCLWAVPDRPLRWLALTGWAGLCAYSIIPYKTPWCLIALIWPFCFVFGDLVARLHAPATGKLAALRWIGIVLALVAGGHSAYAAVRLTFFHSTDEAEPYAYVQTLPEINKLLDPLRAKVRENPANLHLPGYVLFPAGGAHPLPWLLADYTQIRFLEENQAQENLDADVLLIDEQFVADVEDRLRESYFREMITLRGNSGETAELYFRAEKFAHMFPGREPEFVPPEKRLQAVAGAIHRGEAGTAPIARAPCWNAALVPAPDAKPRRPPAWALGRVGVPPAVAGVPPGTSSYGTAWHADSAPARLASFGIEAPANVWRVRRDAGPGGRDAHPTPKAPSSRANEVRERSRLVSRFPGAARGLDTEHLR
jgi:uncharacterized protein (TIGR03663 family)